VSFEGLEHRSDVSAGGWIGPRLHGFGGLVQCVVPGGFPAYARILHPAYDRDGEPVTWAEVCRRTGHVAHGLMQWNSIAGVVRHVTTEGRWPRRHEVGHECSEWPGSEPRIGDVPPETLARVLDVLAGFTDGDADCFHAMWDGWGWLHRGAWFFLTAHDDGSPAPEPLAPAGLPPEIVGGPKLALPGREYVLFRGPLRAALRMGHQVTEEWFSAQSPSLLWPADRSWCLATEIDFDSTLVGGPQALVDALLEAPGLEVWQVEPTDDLTVDGDAVNA
jgi:hypothetical protein